MCDLRACDQKTGRNSPLEISMMVCAGKSSLILGLDVGCILKRNAYFQKLTKLELFVTFLTASYCFSGHKKIIAAHSNYCMKRDLNIKIQTITIFIILDLGPQRRSSRSYSVFNDFFTIFFGLSCHYSVIFKFSLTFWKL